MNYINLLFSTKLCKNSCKRSRYTYYQKYFRKKRNNSTTCGAIWAQFVSLLFLIMYILHVNFCAISSSRKQDQLINKILKKALLVRHLQGNFCKNLTNIYFRITKNIKFHEILWLYLKLHLRQNFAKYT